MSKYTSYINFKIVLVGFLIGIVLTTITTKNTAQNSPETVPEVPVARLWMEHAMDIVKAEPVPPPRSSRFYAYVATAYHDVLLASGSREQASAVTRDIINHLVPSKQAQTDAMFNALVGNQAVVVSDAATAVRTTLIERTETDGANTPWDGSRLQGDQYWVGEKPLEPAAKNWQRWVVQDASFTVPPPPQWGSEDHQQGLRAVKEAAMVRTTEQAAAVNFWGGVPGTEAPAGIWQNVFFSETRDLALSEAEFAYAQKVLAQAVADSFLECWTVKYTYWTKRPSMDDPTITAFLEMDNPAFPSYVSGHSTISRTAAGVLAALFPAKAEMWLLNAAEARDSRLWGGIHFPYDNEQGFALGEQVAAEVVVRLDLAPLRL